MNSAYIKGEITHRLNIAKPGIIFVNQTSGNSRSQVEETVEYPMTLLELDDELLSRNVVSFKNILRSSHAWLDFQICKAVEIRKLAENIMFPLYSSGTTNDVIFCRDPKFLRFKSTDIILSVLPYSAYDMTLAMVQFYNVATAITMISSEPEIYLDVIGKQNVTMLGPPMINFIAKSAIASRCEYSIMEKTIRWVSPLLPVTRPNSWKLQKNPDFRIEYGNNDLIGGIKMTKRHYKKTDNVKSLIFNDNCKIINQETARSIGSRKTLKKRFRKGFLIFDYLKSLHVAADVIIREGWLPSGDLVYYDEDCDFFIVGRPKELIKYKAFPNEIKRLLFSHPDVMYAATASLPNDDSAEVCMALVVKMHDSKVTAKDICELVNEQISPSNKIRTDVHFANVIPRTLAGKIIRRPLPNTVSKL